MNLVIDIGNTSVKVYLFDNDQIVSKNHLNEVSLIEYVNSFSKDFNIKNDIKGKIGSFKISGNKIIQKLDMYSVSNNAFVKGSF